MSEELTVAETGGIKPGGGFMPSSVWRSQAVALLTEYKNAGLLPRGMTEQQAFLVLCRGHELGMQPGEALSTLYVVGGRVALEGEAMVARFHRANIGHIEVLEASPQMARVRVVNRNGSSMVASFGEDDAKRASLTSKDTYKQYPQQMLLWRAIAWGIRVVAPEHMAGLYTREEAESIPDAGGNRRDAAPTPEPLRYIPADDVLRTCSEMGVGGKTLQAVLARKGMAADRVPVKRWQELREALAAVATTPAVEVAEAPTVTDVEFEAAAEPQRKTRRVNRDEPASGNMQAPPEQPVDDGLFGDGGPEQ